VTVSFFFVVSVIVVLFFYFFFMWSFRILALIVLMKSIEHLKAQAIEKLKEPKRRNEDGRANRGGEKA
jgi:hypothetical protein